MKHLRILFLVFSVLGFATTAAAQTTSAARGGTVSGFGTFAASASDGLDRGHGAGASAAYFFSSAIGVRGGVTFQRFDVGETSANALSGGEVTATVITANVVGRFGDADLRPYVTGGMAFYMNDHTIDATLAAQLDQINFRADEGIDDVIGFNVGGGIDFIASERFGVFVEGRYTIAKADTTAGLTDTITNITATLSGEQELNVFAVNAGIRIFF